MNTIVNQFQLEVLDDVKQILYHPVSEFTKAISKLTDNVKSMSIYKNVYVKMAVDYVSRKAICAAEFRFKNSVFLQKILPLKHSDK